MSLGEIQCSMVVVLLLLGMHLVPFIVLVVILIIDCYGIILVLLVSLGVSSSSYLAIGSYMVMQSMMSSVFIVLGGTGISVSILLITMKLGMAGSVVVLLGAIYFIVLDDASTDRAVCDTGSNRIVSVVIASYVTLLLVASVLSSYSLPVLPVAVMVMSSVVSSLICSMVLARSGCIIIGVLLASSVISVSVVSLCTAAAAVSLMLVYVLLSMVVTLLLVSTISSSRYIATHAWIYMCVSMVLGGLIPSCVVGVKVMILHDMMLNGLSQSGTPTTQVVMCIAMGVLCIASIMVCGSMVLIREYSSVVNHAAGTMLAQYTVVVVVGSTFNGYLVSTSCVELSLDAWLRARTIAYHRSYDSSYRVYGRMKNWPGSVLALHHARFPRISRTRLLSGVDARFS
jgi:hypothetical protein